MKYLCHLLGMLFLAVPMAAQCQVVPVAAPAVQSSATPAGPSVPAAPAARQTASGTMDRLELDPTAITGNRELPKVMVIVPWKPADIGDLQGRPLNSLLDEVLAPVDRDVFQREVRYHGALEPDRPASSPVPAGQIAPPATRPET
jgi:hypothetical protein